MQPIRQRASYVWAALLAGAAACGGSSTGPDTNNGSEPGVFDIELRYVTAPTAAQRRAFEDAVARWQFVVTGDLSAVSLDIGSGECGSNAPAFDETIDDLIVLVTIGRIDGTGGTLGNSAPCFVRTASNLPVLARLVLDTADVDNLQATGLLTAVVLHEIGHALGIGTLWESTGFLQDPALDGGSDPHFNGGAAIDAFNDAGGGGYTGSKVPVHASGGPGVADVHWRESVLGNELMTPTVSGTANPLSVITVASLNDMGYTVSLTAADPFTVSATAAVSSDDGWLAKDVPIGPIKIVDSKGRVTGVLDR